MGNIMDSIRTELKHNIDQQTQSTQSYLLCLVPHYDVQLKKCQKT